MQIPFIHRKPTNEETELFRLAMSTFCDGTGQEKDNQGNTRPGWRDYERIVAELLGGIAAENKNIFDVLIFSKNRKEAYGISVKSKQLARASAIEDLLNGGRVHMEISNSPAKFWEALYKKGVKEQDFRQQKKATLIGNTILDVVEGWHLTEAKTHAEQHPGERIDLDNSIYLTISYSKPRNGIPRTYQLHSFDLTFPKNIAWKYISDRCLRGFDPESPEETLIDWYALSGGQLKYYPQAKKAKFSSTQYTLADTPQLMIVDKIKDYWPEYWKELNK